LPTLVGHLFEPHPGRIHPVLFVPLPVIPPRHPFWINRRKGHELWRVEHLAAGPPQAEKKLVVLATRKGR
jgi:hypothetical protein